MDYPLDTVQVRGGDQLGW